MCERLFRNCSLLLYTFLLMNSAHLAFKFCLTIVESFRVFILLHVLCKYSAAISLAERSSAIIGKEELYKLETFGTFVIWKATTVHIDGYEIDYAELLFLLVLQHSHICFFCITYLELAQIPKTHV